ncbi:MAG: type II secretion system F family protein [Microbacteriaceae bacterium]
MAGSATLSYTYKGRDVTGKVVKGTIDAPNEGAVAGRLRSMGIAPIAVTEAVGGTGLNRDLNIAFLEKQPGLKDLSVMSRQMATMISSGLSLLRALTILADQTENKILAKILGQVRNEVEGGTALSSAFQRHPRVFPPLMISLIRAGETGGFLDKSLDSVAVNFEKEAKLKDTIKSAMTYPVMVLIMSVVAVIAMLTFIVPVFETMFENLGSSLPAPTQILVEISHVMPVLLPVLIVAVIAFSVWWRRNKNTDKVRQVYDPMLLKLPVFGLLFKKVAIARFSRNFSTMIGAGVPILQALAIVGETSGNWVIEQATRNVADSVRTGKSIAGPLAQEPVFPPMVVQMISVGEDAGALEQMLDKIADFYEAEVQASTEALTSLIEPLLIGFLGIVVGSIIVALYMPIFSIFDAISGSG